MAELGGWAARCYAGEILIVSAHWQTAPMAISATRPCRSSTLYGFPEHYYRLRSDAPVTPDLAAAIPARCRPEPVLDADGGLDHGAWVPSRRCTRRPTSRSSSSRCRTSTRSTCSRSAAGSRHCATKGCSS